MDHLKAMSRSSHLIGWGGLLLFTVIKFLVDNEFRHWPAWIGLILAILIAIGGYLRYAGDEPIEVNIAKAPSDAPPPAEPPAA